MYDQWVEETEDGKMVGAMMVDLSGAYDMVQFSNLRTKLQLFQLDKKAVDWIMSYVEGKNSQCALMERCLIPLRLIMAFLKAQSLLLCSTSSIPAMSLTFPMTTQGLQVTSTPTVETVATLLLSWTIVRTV